MEKVYITINTHTKTDGKLSEIYILLLNYTERMEKLLSKKNNWRGARNYDYVVALKNVLGVFQKKEPLLKLIK